MEVIMPSYIAAFALQQLRDMEQLQRNFGRRPMRRQRRATALGRGLARVRRARALWTLPHQTRRAPGVSASRKRAAEH
jgi:hypothetical protein